MPQSVLVPARRGSKRLAMGKRQMEQPGLSFQDAAAITSIPPRQHSWLHELPLRALWRDEQARYPGSRGESP